MPKENQRAGAPAPLTEADLAAIEREYGYDDVMRLVAEVRRLRAAVRWALGEEGEFPGTAQGLGAFYWRRELRARAFGAEPARGPTEPAT